LAAALPQVRIIEPRAGHIGMVAGTHAKSALWEPFTDWLRGL
jgi:polyhydroxyalkanoate synthase